MLPSDDKIECAPNGDLPAQNDLLVVQGLAREIEAALPNTSIDSQATVIDLNAARQQRKIKNPAGLEFNTISCLGPHVGPRYALLLDILGYKTLDDLSKAHPIAIASIPGIGEARMRTIAAAIHSRRIVAPLWDSYPLAVPEQLSFDF